MLQKKRGIGVLYHILAVFMVFSMGCSMLQNVFSNFTFPWDKSNGNHPTVQTSGSEGGQMTDNPMQDDDDFTIALSDGAETQQPFTPLEPEAGEVLSDEEMARILSRLPEMEMTADDQLQFNLPAEVLPPPRTGETVAQAFPPEATTDETVEVVDGALEVLRYAPQGEITLAPFISVTFNQAMVPLGTLQQLSELPIPVQVSPALTGTWRWVGTRTLTFNYDSDLIDRLPKATAYRVTIPAGIKSASGNVLAEEVSWTFTTPPPTLLSSFPYEYSTYGLDPLFVLVFDQRINPATVLETIKITADGKAVSARLATEEEITAEERASWLIESTPEGRLVALKPVAALPKDAEIIVRVLAGTASAEGPLTTTAEQEYTFRTYAPLDVEEHGCSYYSEKCLPMQPFFIQFNNELDAEAFKEEMITISPAIEGATVYVVGNTVTIKGMTLDSTTYYVTVSKDIKDEYGQTLGKDKKLTFKVGKAQPVLIGPENTLITVDPQAKTPGLSVHTLNYDQLAVQIYKVQPSDWQAFKTFLSDYSRNFASSNPPGKRVFDKSIKIDGADGMMTETLIDLSKYMDAESGHFIVIVKPPKGFFEKENYWEHIHVWVQVTKIGLDAFVDHSQMVVWATDLRNGSPLDGVTLNATTADINETTDQNGLARFDLPTAGIACLTATLGDDTAILPYSTDFWGDGSWQPRPPDDLLRWYVFDDRSMYRPGEEVHLKGWLRLVGGTQQADVSLAGSHVRKLGYNIVDVQGNTITNGSLEVDAFGGFDLTFTLPQQINLGNAQVILTASGSLSGVSGTMYAHNFQIQEFRRPEFEVTARNETTAPYYKGGSAVFAVNAQYYAGGALPNALATWRVSTTPTNYNPPNWSDYTFGIWNPWWWYAYDEPYGEDETQIFEGKTDATGTHYLNVALGEGGAARPYSIFADVSVEDVNRQVWAASTGMLVHPAAYYVGLRSNGYFVEKGDPIIITLIVVDVDGNPVVDQPVTVTAERLTWKYVDGEWQEIPQEQQTCSVKSSSDAVDCQFTTAIGGKYRITAEVYDEDGRKNQTQITRWVSGGQMPPARNVEKEVATLIPDQETYQPGDVARILVQSPFTPAEGLLTLSRNGILESTPFTMQDGTITLEIPIEEAYIPSLHVQVDLAGAAVRNDDEGNPLADVEPRPAFASGSLALSIPPLDRRLNLTVTPRETQLSPGGTTTIDVVLTDAQQAPVAGANLAVIVVDEAVLALSNYQLADPIAVFYQAIASGVSSTYGRASIILVDPQTLAKSVQEVEELEVDRMFFEEATEEVESEAMMEAPSAMADMDAAAQPIALRTDFNPLALFAPAEPTSADGKASIKLKLPDNLTRYRIMVVAVDESGKLFGSAEANLTARLPLMVRPAATRFLNFGDKFELPVVLQNQTDDAMVVQVVVNTVNIILTDYQGLEVTVPPNDRVEVRFPAKTDMAGTGHFMVAAVSANAEDATRFSLPVYTPATTEAFAVYGVLDDEVLAQPFMRPEGVFPQYGGLEITTSSTALQALTDAVMYLVNYPFDCTEQIASRILGIAALRDVLTAFEADGLPSADDMAASVNADLDMLKRLQNWNGGFPYWRRGEESIPYHTVHVAHALQRAQEMGFTVDAGMLQSVQNYLKNIENYYPAWYSENTRYTISAYALYVRDRMGDSQPRKAADLLADAGIDQLPLDAVAWVWQVLSGASGYETQLAEIRRSVGNRVVETAGAANFVTGYSDDDYVLLHSNRRTDALLLVALIRDNPESDLIPKVVNGLMAHQKRGRWNNTQENVFVLLALDSYFDAFESTEPDFIARVWLGDTYAGSSTFEGYSTDRFMIGIPMDALMTTMADDDQQNLVIQMDGEGLLYYRLGLKYAPTDLALPPVDMGFVVQRVYEAVDDPDDVKQDEDGIWHIKLGARVRVRVSLVADSRRYHVALVVPLPAGLEIINPALAISEPLPDDPTSQGVYGWRYWWRWYQHQNLRDERAEAFTQLLWEGTYEYTFTTRATVPGCFVAPPAKAEEMYSPEVFGRSSGDIVIVGGTSTSPCE